MIGDYSRERKSIMSLILFNQIFVLLFDRFVIHRKGEGGEEETWRCAFTSLQFRDDKSFVLHECVSDLLEFQQNI